MQNTDWILSQEFLMSPENKVVFIHALNNTFIPSIIVM